MDPILIYGAVTAAKQTRPSLVTGRRPAHKLAPTSRWRRRLAVVLHGLAGRLEPEPSWSADTRRSMPAT